MEEKHTFTSSVINAFLKGNLTVLLIILSLVAGAAAAQRSPFATERRALFFLA